jgi:alkyl hydroperoxide reductase subunit AhpC
LREVEAELDALDVAVAIVTFDAGPMAEAYVAQTGIRWPLLVDGERELYRAYGMLRGRAWDLYGPPTIWTYIKLLARGRRLQKTGSDVTQLGGDVLIDPAGAVRLHHVGRGPADRPSVQELLAVVRGRSG